MSHELAKKRKIMVTAVRTTPNGLLRYL